MHHARLKAAVCNGAKDRGVAKVRLEEALSLLFYSHDVYSSADILIILFPNNQMDARFLGRPIEDVLAEELNRRFANKVILDIGLVICLHDITDIGESHLYCGDGAIHTKCVYRMIVFRPQIGEVICGTLKSSSKEGLNISLGFFDSIVIPPQHLNEPSQFNEVDQSWTWNFEDDGKTHVLMLEVGEQIRFRVHSEEFVDISPHGPASLANPMISTNISSKSAPYTIVGSICESGLGLVKWWL